ncbi:MAG: hypothetical protein DRG27_01420 [Deltaproteobacteria bacterium]|nr:MAG: hypothetical protein DRG27_01420 [Deltaproteobacteria bacterium]
MKVSIECVPCFLKQIYEVTGIVCKDPKDQLSLLRECIVKLSELPLRDMKPPQVAKILHSFIKKKSGISDPYKEFKKMSNLIARSLVEKLRHKVKDSEDPFETSLRLAIAGNIIDYGQARDVNDKVVENSIEESLSAELDSALIKRLYNDIQKSDFVLYLGDNAGEVFFDKLFIEHFPKHSVVFAVRGAPIINDATVEDVIEAELHKICTKVIDTGDETPGIVLEDCSKEFIDIFKKADIIISKGQGNFETLSDTKGKRIYFLFKIKCEPVSHETGYEFGRTVILCRE